MQAQEHGYWEYRVTFHRNVRYHGDHSNMSQQAAEIKIDVPRSWIVHFTKLLHIHGWTMNIVFHCA